MPSFNNSQRNSTAESQNNGYPDLALHREKILVIVKAMPSPSKKYRETVCTAGITERGKLIRLYPVNFRYMDFPKWYSKYQWIEVEIEKNEKDNRIDSYRPKVSSIRSLGKPLPTGDWKEREKFVLPLVSKSLEELQKNYGEKKISLGLFKPKTIKFLVEKDNEFWPEKQQRILRQKVLFGKQTKELDKIPYKFSYQFTCNEKACKGHKLRIVDWEIGELYRHLKNDYQYSMDVILGKMRQKWEGQMWSSKRDSYLIVGTQYRYGTPLVLGVFWPPKST